MERLENYNYIISLLPYKSSFLFVDAISALNAGGVTGEYTLKKESFFYEDHFPGNPITPGVIITEIMAQIGLVVLGVYLLMNDEEITGVVKSENSFPVFTETAVTFLKVVLPGEKVTVNSKKQYFRFGKLKCSVEMLNSAGDLIAKGVFSGIIKNMKKRDLLNG